MDSLKKELEEELKLSTDDLRSHAWYHGSIGREVLSGPYFACLYYHSHLIITHFVLIYSMISPHTCKPPTTS